MTRILFVCTGNTCRSPMAEAILRKMNLPGVEVKSAGVFAMNGNEASRHAQTVLDENQISHQHQSTFLTKAEVDWATHIVTMTNGHRSTIINTFPEVASKTFTLKELAGIGVGDVGDPYGGSVDIYRVTFSEIKEAIEKMMDRMKDQP